MSLEVAIVGDASSKTSSYPSDAGGTDTTILPSAVLADVSAKTRTVPFLLQQDSELPEEQTNVSQIVGRRLTGHTIGVIREVKN